jgi:soluble lytic murein transglycosylase
MSISSPLSRPLGDLALSRTAIIATFVTLASIVLYMGANWDQSDNIPNNNTASYQLAATITREADLQGINLLALTGLSEAKKPAYALSSVDRIIYGRIFQAQAVGDWPQANALIKRVHDPVLLGHVLYSRYMQPEYQATYAELRDWMIKYSDHPQAYKIYQMAQSRRDNDPASLPAPQMAKKLFGSLELNWFTKKEAEDQKASPQPLQRDEQKISELLNDVKDDLANSQVTDAYNLLGSSKTTRMLSAVEYDSTLSDIAAGYYYNNKYDSALRLAKQAIKRSDKAVPVAYWIAGLSSWQKGDYKSAAVNFKGISDSQSRNPWMLSAGAFWTARAYHKIGDVKQSDTWLKEAASYPRTFYGQIAKAKLGRNEPFSWKAPELDKGLITAMQNVPAGHRALALLDIGQNNLAQEELMQVHPNGDPTLEKAMIATAHQFKLPALAMRLGNSINQPDGKLYDIALYPMVPWKGDVSVNVDPALINALIRQESQFDNNANNPSGAKGLMQLMPSTAQLVSDNNFNAKDLHNPEVNVALGQRYVRYLSNLPQVKGNLVYLVAAYNAGPRNLKDWQGNIAYKNDPFLFIESLPYSETRGFIERVMTNYWIYGQRLSQETASLNALQNEKWPVYSMPEDGIKTASLDF